MDEDVWAEWDALAVPRPPIPEVFADRLERVDILTLSTRPLPWTLYALDRYLDDATAGRAPYLAVGQAGHGVNSWAMHYYLVTAELQVFVQSRFGGAYADEEQERRRLVARFDLVAALLGTVQAHPPVDGPLRVVESDLARSSWGLVTAGPPVTTPQALRDALESRRGSTSAPADNRPERT